MHESDEYPRTKYFQGCRAVFEGGGCRGAAHIGAFDAAVRCGVNFSEVAGTSAGSIVAALIGAGATPEFLLDKCASLQFSSLLEEPRYRITPIFGWRRVNKFLSLPLKFLGSEKSLLRKIFLVNGAAYSSAKIEDWLDDLLAELLPEASRPIRFKDLILPTSIVAGDLSGRRYKLWSTQHDSGAKVSMAVRCSCSIPLFFEPVESGNDFLVDGGILSNLPAFVFEDRRSTASSLGGPILAFRLAGDDNPKTQWNLMWLLRRLVDTMINGATELQAALQTGISSVEINTGHVSSTDFSISPEDVDFLLNEGRKAMSTFVHNEHDEIVHELSSDLARFGEDELFDDLVREMATPGRRLLVSCDNTRWFWRLFPSVAHWLFGGAQIEILTKPLTGESAESRKEQQRRGYLQKMGARIICRDDVDPNCFIINRHDDRHDAAFICDTSGSAHSPAGVVYVGIKHRVIIGTLRNKIAQHFQDEHKPPALVFVKREGDALIELLKRGVHQYSADSVTIEQREVAIADAPLSLEMIVRRIRTFKFRQVQYLASLFERFSIPFCAPAEIRADGEVVSVITPPVFEQWDNSLIAVEGNTRLFHCIRTRSKSLSCLVVQGVSAPLPGRPVNPRTVLLTTCHLDSAQRIDGFNYDNFRSIERAARPLNNGEG